MKVYGIDKPDTRFDLRFVELNHVAQGKGFKVFDSVELVVGICVSGVDLSKKKKSLNGQIWQNLKKLVVLVSYGSK